MASPDSDFLGFYDGIVRRSVIAWFDVYQSAQAGGNIVEYFFAQKITVNINIFRFVFGRSVLKTSRRLQCFSFFLFFVYCRATVLLSSGLSRHVNVRTTTAVAQSPRSACTAPSTPTDDAPIAAGARGHRLESPRSRGRRRAFFIRYISFYPTFFFFYRFPLFSQQFQRFPPTPPHPPTTRCNPTPVEHRHGAADVFAATRHLPGA